MTDNDNTQTPTRTDAAFDALRADGRRGLMPFIVGGHPAPGSTHELLRAVDDAGADLIEVGLPFSDPIADGPVIASAMHDALTCGATVASVIDDIAHATPSLSAAVLVMTSVSIVHRAGAATFCDRLANAGVAGLIIPDAPLEEAPPLIDAASARGLSATLLIAPTTPPERAAEISQLSTGFIYLLARAGITGEHAGTPDHASLAARVDAIRGISDLPIACGFGVSTPEDARAVTRHADAAIVGSALVRRITDDPGNAASTAASFVRELRRSIDDAAS